MKKLTREQFIKKSRKIHEDKFGYDNFIYKNNKTKGLVTCYIHGDFLQCPNSHLSGVGCPKCKAEKISIIRTYSQDEIIRKFREVHGDRYGYKNFKYIGSEEKSLFNCKKHGDFYQTPSNHLRGQGCPKCGIERTVDSIRLTQEEVIERFTKIHEYRYDYSMFKFINSRVKGKIKCNVCGCIFEQTSSNHLNGAGCPKCKESKGEKLITKILKNNKIEFISQYTIPNNNCRFRYDFYLPDYKLLIEFHGRQHYEPVKAFGGEKEFKNILFRDACKRSLAWDYGIPLIEINYKYLKQLNEEQFEKYFISLINRTTRRNRCQILAD